MAAYFFASPIDVDIKLEGEESRKQVEMKGEKDKTTSCPVYYDGDSIGGQVCAVHLLASATNTRDRSQSEYGTERNSHMTGLRWNLLEV